MPLPFIPNELNKILVYVGIGLLVYFYVEYQKKSDAYDLAYIAYMSDYAKLKYQEKILSTELIDIEKEVNFRSNKLKIPSPLEGIDSGSVFVHALTGFKFPMSDSIIKLLQRYDSKRIERNGLRYDLAVKELQKKQQYSLFDSADSNFSVFGIAGWIIFIFGLVRLYMEEGSKRRFQQQHSGENCVPGFCQSCGKNFNAFIRNGTEKDGKGNPHFCNNCYMDGKFIEPDLTVDIVIIRAKEDLVTIGTPAKKVDKLINEMKGLDRWRSQHYY